MNILDIIGEVEELIRMTSTSHKKNINCTQENDSARVEDLLGPRFSISIQSIESSQIKMNYFEFESKF